MSEQPVAPIADLSPRHLRVLILLAFQKAGLDHLKDAMTTFLHGAAGRMLSGGAADLSSLWSVLSGQEAMETERVEHALLLVASYLEQLLHAPVHMPDAMRQALQAAAVLREATIVAELVELQQQVAAELNEAPAAPPVTQALPEPKRPEPVAPPPSVSFKRKRGGRRSLRTVLGAIAMVPVLVWLGMNLYAGHDRDRRVTAHLHLNREALSAVVPIENARVSGQALLLLLADKDFGAAPPARQKQIARSLFAALEQDDINTLFLISGKERFRFDRQGQEVTMAPFGPASGHNKPNAGETDE